MNERNYPQGADKEPESNLVPQSTDTGSDQALLELFSGPLPYSQAIEALKNLTNFAVFGANCQVLHIDAEADGAIIQFEGESTAVTLTLPDLVSMLKISSDYQN